MEQSSQITSLDYKEQIMRKVSVFGNGAHIFAPKEWRDEKVLVIRLEKKSIKEQVLEMLLPNLDKVIAAGIYGSHARKEESESSDIDIIVFVKEKFKLIKPQNFEVLMLEESSISRALEANPLMVYSIFKEAVPIINQSYFEKLKAEQVNKSLFKQFIVSTRESINSDKELLELDKKTGKYASNAVIYSLILRLRGIFLAYCLLKNKEYSNKSFRKWITRNCKISTEAFYEVYQAIRDNKKIKEKIPLEQAELALAFLEKEIKTLDSTIK